MFEIIMIVAAVLIVFFFISDIILRDKINQLEDRFNNRVSNTKILLDNLGEYLNFEIVGRSVYTRDWDNKCLTMKDLKTLDKEFDNMRNIINLLKDHLGVVVIKKPSVAEHLEIVKTDKKK
jgi:hypothetical protein